MSDFISRDLGRCVTEYRHKDYDQLVKQFKYFYKVSQFDTRRNGYELVAYVGTPPNLSPTPSCSAGEIVYGWNPETGKLIKLISKIDSSD